MDTRTIVALYDDLSAANSAVRALLDRGLTREDISVVAYNSDTDAVTTTTGTTSTERTDVEAGEGASFGAVVGALTGLVAGLTAIIIPGIGPIIAAGPLAAVLGGAAGAAIGAGAGALTGGLTASLVDLGVPAAEVETFSEGVRRGGTLVTVHTPASMEAEATTILESYNPTDINGRAARWREEGWSGTSTAAMTEEELMNERIRRAADPAITTGTLGGVETTGTPETTGEPRRVRTYSRQS